MQAKHNTTVLTVTMSRNICTCFSLLQSTQCMNTDDIGADSLNTIASGSLAMKLDTNVDPTLLSWKTNPVGGMTMPLGSPAF